MTFETLQNFFIGSFAFGVVCGLAIARNVAKTKFKNEGETQTHKNSNNDREKPSDEEVSGVGVLQVLQRSSFQFSGMERIFIPLDSSKREYLKSCLIRKIEANRGKPTLSISVEEGLFAAILLEKRIVATLDLTLDDTKTLIQKVTLCCNILVNDSLTLNFSPSDEDGFGAPISYSQFREEDDRTIATSTQVAAFLTSFFCEAKRYGIEISLEGGDVDSFDIELWLKNAQL